MKSKDSENEDEEPVSWPPLDALSDTPKVFVDPLEVARQVRNDLLRDQSWLTPAEVISRLNVAICDADPVEYLSHLKQEKRLLGVIFRNQHLYPAFQFQTDGSIHPSMPEVLAFTPLTRLGWQTVFWFFQPTGYLRGAQPAQRLAIDPQSVVCAAQRDFDPSCSDW
ncbi:hypothetical protein ELE36_03175 [Pseudolysobacter antarcticus]|uniref:Uncharacterized protein n=2 Tax=Pseudolysobacter antarcticus TaxID=2511995 RepID=A0A411HG20_9GAMM|nr:hypothetical protein ELE36_03175 [Pseudolysobacter antarcticus]